MGLWKPAITRRPCALSLHWRLYDIWNPSRTVLSFFASNLTFCKSLPIEEANKALSVCVYLWGKRQKEQKEKYCLTKRGQEGENAGVAGQKKAGILWRRVWERVCITPAVICMLRGRGKWDGVKGERCVYVEHKCECALVHGRNQWCPWLPDVYQKEMFIQAKGKESGCRSKHTRTHGHTHRYVKPLSLK